MSRVEQRANNFYLDNQSLIIITNLHSKMNYSEITKSDKRFPKKLREIPDCPQKLYCIGNVDLFSKPIIAIVGSRKASEYGKIITKKFASYLASNGYVIASGLAIGIDAQAHKSALSVEGYTIAVLGTGIDEIYPASNKSLADEILKKKGLIVSEFSPKTPFAKYNFPLRNRIIAGLSQAVIISEAAEESGSLITAKLACEYGREVFGVPQNITNFNSHGVNDLIKGGANVLSSEGDLEEFFGAKGENKKIASLSLEEREVFELITVEAMDFEQISKKSKLSADKLSAALVYLELKGLARCQSNVYFRC
ncbi:DNA-protecting protein DprA [Candidatus Berkelbacteria bacterium CG10_big_fil_rev_8_21_14_0_10_41_12]|uniref:DNA-protecting protein DprA n=1 Tax=Candidatus Berkelbacteria bacterium CG10_big_fil_rev_8_21_14_0_10_41_12 TaxID=1974513 RepID=A0A2M6WXR1_9BACT|nr:MAG: DNA-protecting protein DprA [Candidatus Berkelbacteria bacterium CG10_big_fil_rev_8_21_14_0_10_41_12]